MTKHKVIDADAWAGTVETNDELYRRLRCEHLDDICTIITSEMLAYQRLASAISRTPLAKRTQLDKELSGQIRNSIETLRRLMARMSGWIASYHWSDARDLALLFSADAAERMNVDDARDQHEQEI